MDSKDAIDLEEAFFARKHAELLEDLRKRDQKEQRREALRKIVSIKDDAFLDRLIAFDITPERALALRMIPLIFVAWADGAIDDREREAILRAAEQEGLTYETATSKVLSDWLETPPDQRVLTLWKTYIRKIWERFTPDEQWQMRENLIEATQKVATAAGGFLGIGKISAAEKAVLDDLRSIVD